MSESNESEVECATTILAGVFEPQGVSEVHTVDIPEELNGITFNRLSPKLQYMVSLKADLCVHLSG